MKSSQETEDVMREAKSTPAWSSSDGISMIGTLFDMRVQGEPIGLFGDMAAKKAFATPALSDQCESEFVDEK